MVDEIGDFSGKYLDAKVVLSAEKDLKRFLDKIEQAKNIQNDKGCWIWPSVENNGDYGIFGIAGSSFRAHRLSYAYFIGSIPSGQVVRHKVCDNILCVNYEHLLLGSMGDNNRDRIKGERKSRINKPSELRTQIILEETIKDFWGRTIAIDECLIWKDGESFYKDGYGRFKWQGRADRSHIFSFRLAHGRWPKLNYVLGHTCHNKRCVNSRHLIEFTKSDHIKYDCAAGIRSEGHKGQRHNVKLTDAQIIFIKEAIIKTPAIRDSDLSKILGDSVTSTCIADVRKGKTGNHVVVDGFTPILTKIPNPRKGMESSLCKITPNQIFEMRKIFSEEKVSLSEIGRRFGISSNHAAGLIYGESQKIVDTDISAEGYYSPLIRPPFIKRSTSTEERAAISKLYMENKTAKEISELVNDSERRVNRIITKLQKEGKIEPRQSRTTITEEDIEILKQFYVKGYSSGQAEKETDYKLPTIEKYFRIFREDGVSKGISEVEPVRVVITEEIISELRKLFLEGIYYAVAADKVGVAKATAFNYFKKFSIELNMPMVKLPRRQITKDIELNNKVLALIKEGKTYNQIAEILNIKRRAVDRIVLQLKADGLLPEKIDKGQTVNS